MPREARAHIQRQVTDPTACVWVSASAGTGKTKVLIDRVLALLISGVTPSSILCLTFTKAAATEMNDRVRQRLLAWSVITPEERRSDLEELLGREPTVSEMIAAERLLGELFDNNLNIMTIHSFCSELLSRFPLEAGLSPYREVMDDLAKKGLLTRLQRELLATHAPELEDDVKTLAPLISYNKLNELIEQFLVVCQNVMGLDEKSFQDEEAFAAYQASLQQKLGVSVLLSEEELIKNCCNDPLLEIKGLHDAVRSLAAGGRSDQAKATFILKWLTYPDERVHLLQEYRDLFLTKDGRIRKNLCSAQVRCEDSHVETVLLREAERLIVWDEKRKNTLMARATLALVRIARALAKAYNFAKDQHHCLDYQDLVFNALALLTSQEMTPWVLYKLDQRFRHLLVDEAQDTNPAQWRLVAALCQEFFSGEEPTPRTLFVVGDSKQSIYGFQGASAEDFFAYRALFRHQAHLAQKKWWDVTLDRSYRSTAVVLNAVDRVFAHPLARQGVVKEREEAVYHESALPVDAGVVALFPLAVAEEGDFLHPRQKTAEAIALQVKSWLDTRKLLATKGRPFQPGDCMVLVRQRGQLVDDVVDAFRKHSIPVAGQDRFTIGDHLAIHDLVALGHFLVYRRDNLSLANVLKGPFFGFDEEALFALAYQRGKATLWQRLGEVERNDHQRAYQKLIRWRELAHSMTAYAFYMTLLIQEGGRNALMAYFGSDVHEVIDEFLRLCVHYERSSPATLQGFLNWFEEWQRSEVKRALDQPGLNQVRIMTIHGAKGLQAPVVMLADCAQVPDLDGTFLPLSESGSSSILWVPRAEFRTSCLQEAMRAHEQRLKEEYNRLLYVAMTRAEEELYLYGWKTRANVPEDSWYACALSAFAHVAVGVPHEASSLDALLRPIWQESRVVSAEKEEVAQRWVSDSLKSAPEEQLPSWIKTPAQQPQISAQPLTPSQQAGEGGEAILRGTYLHQLLQFLASVPRRQRHEVGCEWLARQEEIDSFDHASLLQEVMALFENPQLQWLWTEESLSEVEVTGIISGQRVRGRIDRLCFIDNKVIVVDYKSHRMPLQDIKDIPSHYVKQLALYVGLLQQQYPERCVEGGVLWTSQAEFMLLPREILEEAVRSIA